MKALIIGKGGREHAIADAFRRSVQHVDVTVAPGNPGMSFDGIATRPVDMADVGSIVEVARETRASFVVIGPEDPLAIGAADALREAGVKVVGPGAEGARLETSKIYAKEIMSAAGVPTAAWQSVETAWDLRSAIDRFGATTVLKADGLAQGKGVFVASSEKEAFEEGRRMLQRYGRLLAERAHEGFEVSLITLTDGVHVTVFPLAHDHKRRRAGERGPNTGGMGVVAPVGGPQEAADLARVAIRPVLDLFARRNQPYSGFLYAGIMITKDGPLVLEYNVRPGDPETEALLPVTDVDFADLMARAASGKVRDQVLDTAGAFATAVVVVEEGYPSAPRSGELVRLSRMPGADERLYWAGVSGHEEALIVSGGRVAVAVGIADERSRAQARARDLAGAVRFPGSDARADIGWPSWP